jgi:hypothetical protein
MVALYSIIKELRQWEIADCLFVRPAFLQRAIDNGQLAILRAPHRAGLLAVTSNPNMLQTPYRRREENPRKNPPHGNLRPSRDLWPEKLFKRFSTLPTSSATQRGRLSF